MTNDGILGENARVIVLLGCVVRAARPGDGGDLGLAPGAALRRVRAAVAVHASAREAGVETGLTVIASGGRAWRAGVEADVLARALVRAGVPEASVVRERCSFTTKENARYVARLLHRRARGEEARVVLVTCDWHMPRAEALFAAEGMMVRAAPAQAEAAVVTGLAAKGGLLKDRAYRWLRERVAARLDGSPA
jgi:uncharacterized SAM-binding protein YcdF (DUF218 family)